MISARQVYCLSVRALKREPRRFLVIFKDFKTFNTFYLFSVRNVTNELTQPCQKSRQQHINYCSLLHCELTMFSDPSTYPGMKAREFLTSAEKWCQTLPIAHQFSKVGVCFRIQPEKSRCSRTPVSHREFVRGFEGGSLGCGVSSFQILRLLFTGQLTLQIVLAHLVSWLVGLLLLIAACFIGLISLPVYWALPGTGALLGFYGVAFLLSTADRVLSVALKNEEFYDLIRAQRALIIIYDDEMSLSKPSQATTPAEERLNSGLSGACGKVTNDRTQA